MARNEFSGTCYRCKLPVVPGTGHFEKVRYEDRGPGNRASWKVQHGLVPGDGRVTCEQAKAEAAKLQFQK